MARARTDQHCTALNAFLTQKRAPTTFTLDPQRQQHVAPPRPFLCLQLATTNKEVLRLMRDGLVALAGGRRQKLKRLLAGDTERAEGLSDLLTCAVRGMPHASVHAALCPTVNVCRLPCTLHGS